MAEYRLQKILSAAGICSRREAEILIKRNIVLLNGKTANLGDKADPKIDNISVNGRQIPQNLERKTILLNKPKKIISSCSDDHGRKTVISLLPPDLRKGMYPIGRLDYDSRGAILITNNGDLTLRLTHPRFNHPKFYSVWVKGIPTKSTLTRWREGIELDGRLISKSSVNIVRNKGDNALLEIILREGRNRQIRRVSEILGHKVIDLKRVAISSIKLNGLKEGEWRHLSHNELLSLYK